MDERLLRFIRRNLVANVPPALDLCFSCREPRCDAEAVRRCAARRQRQAELEADQSRSRTIRRTSSA